MRKQTKFALGRRHFSGPTAPDARRMAVLHVSIGKDLTPRRPQILRLSLGRILRIRAQASVRNLPQRRVPSTLARSIYTGTIDLHWHDRSTLARSIYTGTIDLHWHDRSTLARSIYTGTFDLHWRDRTALARSKWFNGWPPRESSAPNPSLRRRCYYILGRVTPNRLQDAVIAAEKKSTTMPYQRS